MDATQHLVTLGPTAVELFDSTMIELSRDIAMFRPVVDRFVRGAPGAILLVEFAEEDQQENLHRLTALGDMMAQLGFRWGDEGKREGGVVEAVERTEEHTSELQSLMRISYAVFCLKKK